MPLSKYDLTHEPTVAGAFPSRTGMFADDALTQCIMQRPGDFTNETKIRTLTANWRADFGHREGYQVKANVVGGTGSTQSTNEERIQKV
jgi:hypothetical protein